eukprot:UN00239
MQRTYATPTGQYQYQSNATYSTVSSQDKFYGIPQDNFYGRWFHPSLSVILSTIFTTATAIPLYKAAKDSEYVMTTQRRTMFIILFSVQAFLFVTYTLGAILRWFGYPNWHFKYHPMNKYTSKAVQMFQPNPCRSRLSTLFTFIAIVASITSFVFFLRIAVLFEPNSWTKTYDSPTTWVIVQQILLVFSFFGQINNLLNEMNRKSRRTTCAKLANTEPLIGDEAINYSL